ncbi:serine/threonine-protein kinase [Marinicella meishanensis]|uniref:serine/threonine-protein kinase n=1 Tax=Marinicella meishanensis TaxID=2873263 RepID=UPI001CC14D62|nr:serine/threonine-protein kinase [Marinicella sp. NBU2979]
MTEINLEQWKQAHQIYAKLMDLTVSDALQQLQQHSDADDTIKGLVLQLISSGNQPSQFFQQDISAQIQAGMRASEALQVGDQLGEYELLEALGQGGMASVFKARRMGVESQKPVAIKTFDHPSAGGLLAERFAVEQEILSGLSHPNIVNMHHGGSSEAGVPYIVMELIDSATDIDVYAKQQQASLRQIVRWMVQAARAIAYAHNNLVVHRDIKPSNLLMDGRGQLKVVDFGIAKLMSQPEAPQKTTIMALTPSYAAPEQINSGPISVATDVFSLAAVGLALITGDAPLPKDRLLKSCVDDETHIWQQLKAHVPDKDLRNILNQALQQDPQKRYRNMELLANDWTAWLDNKPVQATPDSWWYRLQKFARRRRALFAAMTTSVVILTVAITLLSLQYRKTLLEAEKARQAKDFMLNVFAGANPDLHEGQQITAIDVLNLASEEIGYKEFTDERVKSDVLGSLGAAFNHLGAEQAATENLQAAIAYDPDNLAAQLNLAQLYVDQSKADAAASLLSQVESKLDRMINPAPALSARLLLLRSSHSTFTNDYPSGIKWAQQARTAYQAMGDQVGVLVSTRLLTEKMDAMSDTEAATALAKQTIEQVQGLVSPVNSEYLRLRTTLVYLYNQLGQNDQALAEISGVIDALEQSFGSQHPARLDALVQRAMAHRNQGQVKLAMADATEALSLAELAYGPTSQMGQQALSLMAQMNFSRGDREQAVLDLQRVVAMSTENYGFDHRMTLDAQTELANYLGALGRFDEALPLVRQAENLYTEQFGIDSQQAISAINTRLKLLASAQRVDADVVAQAEANHLRSVEVAGATNPLTAYTRFVLGNVYSTAGQFELANQTFIGLIEDGIVPPNNDRHVALTQSISNNYQRANNWPKAKEYAEISLQSCVSVHGEYGPRTTQIRLALIDVLQQMGDESATSQLALLRQAIDDGVIADEQLISAINARLDDS